MKNFKYLLFTLVILFITTISVNAATITKATYDGEIKVDGTGDGQIQIVLFDSKNNPIYMTTTSATNGNFSITLPKIDNLKTGDYKIKVADYDGNNIDDEVLKVVIKPTSNPKTNDNILKSLTITSLSIIGILFIRYIKKNILVKKAHN